MACAADKGRAPFDAGPHFRPGDPVKTKNAALLGTAAFAIIIENAGAAVKSGGSPRKFFGCGAEVSVTQASAQSFDWTHAIAGVGDAALGRIRRDLGKTGDLRGWRLLRAIRRLV